MIKTVACFVSLSWENSLALCSIHEPGGTSAKPLQVLFPDYTVDAILILAIAFVCRRRWNDTFLRLLSDASADHQLVTEIQSFIFI